MLFSCTKDVQPDGSIGVPKIASYGESEKLDRNEFVHSLKRELENVDITQRTVDPRNPLNFMDDLGVYFSQCLISVNNSEQQSPSISSEAYTAKWLNYMDENPVQYDFTEIVTIDEESLSQLIGLIKASFKKENTNLSISEMKLIESAISTSALFSEAEKNGLLGFSSIMKHVRSTLATDGVIVNGVVYDFNDLNSGWFDCFENVMNNTMIQNTHILTQFSEEPVLCTAAWVGLPSTLGWGLADSIYQGVTNC